MPKISVCIPTFNAADYLNQSISSALEQNYPDFEIVVVDNCSTDDSVSVITGLQQRSNGRIRFYQNEQNIGLVGNLNKCLEYAQGDYIKFLCADDLLLPGCLEQMAAVLDTQPSVTLVASGRAIIDGHGRHVTVKRHSRSDVLVPGTQAITECLFGRHYIGEPTAAMFRKSDVQQGFREDMPQVLDIDMWFRLLEQGDLLYIGAPLCAIRYHASQMTNANIKSSALIDDNIKLFEIYSHKPYIKPTLRYIVQHRIFITYRLWRSRLYVSQDTKDMVLRRYGSFLAYALMPAASFALNLATRIFTGLKSLSSQRPTLPSQ